MHTILIKDNSEDGTSFSILVRYITERGVVYEIANLSDFGKAIDLCCRLNGGIAQANMDKVVEALSQISTALNGIHGALHTQLGA